MCYHVGTPSKSELKTKLPKKQITYDQGEIWHVSGFARPFLPVTLNTDSDSVVSAR